MKLMNSVKGKVIAGTMAVTLLSGAGVAFGASDAGVKVKAWYDVQFGKASANVESSYTGYQKDQLGEFNKTVTGLKDDATKKINDGASLQISTKSKNIDDQKKEHIDIIKKEKESIESYMDNQFKSLSDKAKIEIDSATSEALGSAEAAMLKHTNEIGAVAFANVQKELKASTETAVDELKKAIADAKFELQKQLDSKSSATTKELKEVVDSKIKILDASIIKTKNQLVSGHNKIITNAAQGLEDAAMTEMEGIVNGI